MQEFEERNRESQAVAATESSVHCHKGCSLLEDEESDSEPENRDDEKSWRRDGNC